MDTDQAFKQLMQMDELVGRISNKTATESDIRAFNLLMPYEIDAYIVFCETRLQMVKEEINRRSESP